MSFGAVPASSRSGAAAGVPASAQAANSPPSGASAVSGKPAPDGLSENEIQKSVFSHLRMRPAPGVFAFHPKNASADMAGRKRGIHVGLGIEPGVTDIIAFQVAAPCLCRVFALELKREDRRGKKPTPHELKQAATRERMANAGAIVGVAYGLAEAIAWLEARGLLRGTMS
jgi:hypothetical protein